MTGQTVVQIGAIVFVAFAITATAIGWVRKDEAQDPGIAQPAQLAIDPLRAELARCQDLGEAGPRDATCLAAWATARRRFLGDGPRSDQPRNTTVVHKNSYCTDLRYGLSGHGVCPQLPF